MIIFEKTEHSILCYACEKGLTGKTKLCYVCKNDLIGQTNSRGDEYECHCEDWECKCDEIKESNISAYCPICESWFRESKYLEKVFADPKVRWLANMVTHYRHSHRKWESQHKYISKYIYSENAYEIEKAKINEQAKRQIIRLATEFLMQIEMTKEHFQQLKGTDEKTMQLAEKKLDKKLLM